jgi:AcrR family transcriptional regulator
MESNEAVQHPVAAVPSLKARKQKIVREIIWDAATDLFVKKGFDETTVDDIAQAAGISPRSFFRYFASKGDLMAYSLVTYGDQLIAAIEACPKSYSLGEVFRKTVLQVTQESAEHPRTRKVLEILRKHPAAAAAQMSRLGEVQGLVARAFARRLPKGSEDSLTAGVMAGMTLQLTGVTVRWCFEQGQSDVSVAMERVLATFERMFCGTRLPNRGSGQRH